MDPSSFMVLEIYLKFSLKKVKALSFHLETYIILLVRALYQLRTKMTIQDFNLRAFRFHILRYTIHIAH